MLRGVKPSPELLEKLNGMNASFSFARAFVTDETVCIAMELFAEELTTEQISYACGLITFAADHWDDELKRSFGGETFFEGSPADEKPQDATASNEADPKTEAEPGGYL
jgi:hypothetical protein